jgi:subfamily B ATP-binding cassette protein MsbA
VKSKNLPRFFAFVRPYRKIVACAFCAGVLRYLLPLILPWSLKVIIDELLAPDTVPSGWLHLVMGVLVVLYAFHGVVSYFRSYLAGLTGHRIIFDLRQVLYQHVQRMSLGFFERQKIGEVVARMTSDIAAAQNLVGQGIINVAMDLVFVTVVVTLLGATHWRLMLVAVSVLPVYAAVSRTLTRQIRKRGSDIQKEHQAILGELHEQFAGIATIQAFGQEESEARQFRARSERHLGFVLDNVHLQAAALGVTAFLTTLGPVLVLWYGTVEVWSGRLSVGTLMAFYAYLGMLYQPIQRLTELSLVMASSLAAIDRIFEVFDTYPEVADSAEARPLGRAEGRVSFERVEFAYPSKGPLFRGLDFEIPAGKSVALVGASGAGKSTIAKLLLRFYDVSGGRIAIDGRDIRGVTLRSLRENIAVVPQDPILFSGTVAENLRYGRPGATFDQMREAARAAFAEAFIDRLPGGYDAEIGERGTGLSGGERQRLAIARAFLRDAPLLIMDEPTSALDAESETLVKEAVRRLLRGRTALIIAHRLSTLEHADAVLVLENGRVAESGPPAELLAAPGSLYRRYASLQLAKR